MLSKQYTNSSSVPQEEDEDSGVPNWKSMQPEPVSDDFEFKSIGQAAIEVISNTLEILKVSDSCDSPIEQDLGRAIIARFNRDKLALKVTLPITDYPTPEIYLVSQFRWNIYRSDWAIIKDRKVWLVECDGKEFHSSQEQ